MNNTSAPNPLFVQAFREAFAAQAANNSVLAIQKYEEAIAICPDIAATYNNLLLVRG